MFVQDIAKYFLKVVEAVAAFITRKEKSAKDDIENN